MNASDWRKAAALINHQQAAAATVQIDQLDSMPLSTLSLDDSGPPVVKHGLYGPLAASTPNRTDTHNKITQQGDTYQQISQVYLKAHYILLYQPLVQDP